MFDSLCAGFAARKITPSLGVTMAGYAAREGGAIGIHDDLYTHAMVLRAGSKWVAIISMDLVEIPDDLASKIREAVGTKTDIPSEAILVGATHTHSGPLVSSGFGETGNAAIVDRIAEITVMTVLEALDGLHPVRIKVGSVKVPDIGKNRRSLEPSPDPELNFIGFYFGNRLAGCLVNFPLHATVLGAENRQYTADYPGYLRRTIQAKHPLCHTLFLNGAAGNINIGYSADASALGEVFDFRTFEKAAEVGQRLGTAVLDGLDAADWVDNAGIEARELGVALPLKNLPSVAGLGQQIAQKTQAMDKLQAMDAWEELGKIEVSKIYLECLRDSMLHHEIKGQQQVVMPLQALQIGSAILVAIPGELFVELGLAIRQSRGDYRIFLVGYANGAWGYLPNQDAFAQGGYEVETSIFNEKMEEALVQGAAELVKAFA